MFGVTNIQIWEKQDRSKPKSRTLPGGLEESNEYFFLCKISKWYCLMWMPRLPLQQTTYKIKETILFWVVPDIAVLWTKLCSFGSLVPKIATSKGITNLFLLSCTYCQLLINTLLIKKAENDKWEQHKMLNIDNDYCKNALTIWFLFLDCISNAFK